MRIDIKYAIFVVFSSAAEVFWQCTLLLGDWLHMFYGSLNAFILGVKQHEKTDS